LIDRARGSAASFIASFYWAEMRRPIGLAGAKALAALPVDASVFNSARGIIQGIEDNGSGLFRILYGHIVQESEIGRKVKIEIQVPVRFALR